MFLLLIGRLVNVVQQQSCENNVLHPPLEAHHMYTLHHFQLTLSEQFAVGWFCCLNIHSAACSTDCTLLYCDHSTFQRCYLPYNWKCFHESKLSIKLSFKHFNGFWTQILGNSEHKYAYRRPALIRKKSVLISYCNFFKRLFRHSQIKLP